MPKNISTSELCLSIIQGLGIYALDKLRNAKGPAPTRHERFNALAWNAATDAELKKLKDVGLSAIGPRCIILPVKEVAGRSWAPLLWITEKPDGDHRLQLVIAGDGSDQRPFGFRWEPSEGSRAPDHDYWHAQPITAVLMDGQPDATFGTGEISTRLPTFPIDASDRLSLLDALFVSIYGPGYLELYKLSPHVCASVKKCTLKRGWSSVRIALSAAATAVGVKKPPRKGQR